jgi:hypothetical protein
MIASSAVPAERLDEGANSMGHRIEGGDHGRVGGDQDHGGGNNNQIDKLKHEFEKLEKKMQQAMNNQNCDNEELKSLV